MIFEIMDLTHCKDEYLEGCVIVPIQVTSFPICMLSLQAWIELCNRRSHAIDYYTLPELLIYDNGMGKISDCPMGYDGVKHHFRIKLQSVEDGKKMLASLAKIYADMCHEYEGNKTIKIEIICYI